MTFQSMKTKEQAEKEKLFKKISRKLGQTIREHNLIEEGDRVLLGLSGGKDSIILLESLASRKKSFQFSFDLIVAHVHPVNLDYKINIPWLQDLCDNSGVEFILREIHPDITNSDKAPCFVCSWHRRKALFDLTKSLNCNKLAMGHHRDDALQTFLMNMLHHGSISSMPYSLKLFEGRLHLIRPLLNLWEEELETYAALCDYSAVEKTCPYENKTARNKSAELLKMLEKENPSAKINMFHALSNIYPEYLPDVKKKSD